MLARSNLNEIISFLVLIASTFALHFAGYGVYDAKGANGGKREREQGSGGGGGAPISAMELSRFMAEDDMRSAAAAAA